MSTPGPDHERWAGSVGSYLLGALPAEEHDDFAAHFVACPVCRRDAEELAIAADALPASVPPVPAPPALKNRIMAVVEAEAELLAAAGGRADEPPRPRSRARRGLLAGWLPQHAVALACAAALLVAGGVVGALLADGDGPRSVVAHTRPAHADVRLEIHDGASKLVARGMPAPPAGRIYQVWLKRPGRDPQPTSVLWSTRRDGSAEVAVPGSLDGIEAVLVTDEPAGGSDVPSKPPVIAAPVA